MRINNTIYSNKELVRICKEVSIENNIPLCAVMLVYKSFWDNIKEHIELVDFNNEFDNKYQMSFNIPSIGKLFTNTKRINKVNNRRLKYNASIESKESNTTKG